MRFGGRGGSPQPVEHVDFPAHIKVGFVGAATAVEVGRGVEHPATQQAGDAAGFHGRGQPGAVEPGKDIGRGRAHEPAFAVERSQELLHDIGLLIKTGEISPSLVFLDSPLASKVTGVYRKYAAMFEDIAKKLDVSAVRVREYAKEWDDLQKLVSRVIPRIKADISSLPLDPFNPDSLTLGTAILLVTVGVCLSLELPLAEIGKALVGQTDVIDAVLCALLAGGGFAIDDALEVVLRADRLVEVLQEDARAEGRLGRGLGDRRRGRRGDRPVRADGDVGRRQQVVQCGASRVALPKATRRASRPVARAVGCRCATGRCPD